MTDPVEETEIARLRAVKDAAQRVIDSINDENEIDPDAIFALSAALLACQPGLTPLNNSV